MKFGELIKCQNPLVGSDLNNKYVGFSDYNDNIKTYFSKQTIRTISIKLTQLLRGIVPGNRPIIVPDDKIAFVMDAIYSAYRPPTSDVYGRYNIPTGRSVESYVQDMIDQVIEVIFSDVKNSLQTEYNNSKLSAWVQVLGDGLNDNNLRSYPPIKTRLRRPNPMEINMRY